MSRTRQLRSLGSRLLPLLICLTCSLPLVDAAEQLPNIVFIMADDMGYGDAGCYNPESKIPTPNIDRLAKQGLRFTDAHAPAAVCVPTRYGLLTGRYPFRMTRKRNQSLVEADRLTIGSLLQSAGYTTACIGKWHLGFDGGTRRDDYSKPMTGGPVDRGFDYYFGIPASLDIPPYYWIENDMAVVPPTASIEASNSPGWTRIQGAFWREGKVAPGFKHADILKLLAIRSSMYLELKKQASERQPFFLYVALPAPHTPWLPSRNHLGKSKAGMYGDFMHEVDASVGRILKTIDTLELTENTLVIYTSDNGPVWYPTDVERLGHSSTGPLRGMKGDAWEGGHRMPFIVRWPGEIAPQGTCHQTICHTDMLATFADITGRKLPGNAGEDSFSILPALRQPQSAKAVRPALVSQSSGRALAIRQGPWKLIPQLGSGGFSQPRRVKPTTDGPQGQLYRLDQDLGESKNLWQQEPQVVQRLTDLLKKYRADGRSRPR